MQYTNGDGQMDGQTDTSRRHGPRLCIASRGNDQFLPWWYKSSPSSSWFTPGVLGFTPLRHPGLTLSPQCSCPMHCGCTCVLTTEEICVDDIFSGRWRNDLYVGVDGRRQSAPALSDVERITKACPVEPILVHPVSLAAKEIRVVYVAWRRIATWRVDFPQPVEHNVEPTLCRIQPHTINLLLRPLLPSIR